MKYADINKRFTEIVAEYISKGYTINTATMCGTQGEIAKIDLTDGKEIVRVIIESFSDFKNDISGFAIIVGKSTCDVKPNKYNTWHTIWNSLLEIMHTERFYNICENKSRGEWFVTETEAEQAKRIQYDRLVCGESDVKPFKSDKALEIAKRYIRRKTGVKRIKADCISVSKCGFGRATYMVNYRDKVYILR